jgi:hypothetical protein
MSDTAHGRDDDPLGDPGTGTISALERSSGDERPPRTVRRCFGSMRGQFQVPDSFFELMPEEELALWEGASEPFVSEEATASGSSDDDK